MFGIFALFIAIVAWTLAVLPLRLSWRWRGGLTLLIAVTAFKFHLLGWFGNANLFAPEAPRILLLAGAWLYAILLCFCFWLIIHGGIWLIARLIYRLTACPKCQYRRIYYNRSNLAALAAIALLCTYGIIQGIRVPEVKSVTMAIPGLPPKAENLHLVLLTDLHADRISDLARMRAIVQKVNQLKADVIAIAGDFVDGSVAQYQATLAPLKDLQSRYGVFGVPGNHEYYSGYSGWLAFLTTLNIQMLENRAVKLPDCQLFVAGITDPAAARFNLPLPDVKQALHECPDGYLPILLSHQMRQLAEAEAAGVKLQLSGHTHGGLFWGLDYLIGRFNFGYVSGLYQVGKMQLYVSNGSGLWNGLPIRIGHPSEITSIKLVSQINQ